jgi:PAS domain-containing protein
MVNQIIALAVIIALGLAVAFTLRRWRDIVRFAARLLTELAAALRARVGEPPVPALEMPDNGPEGVHKTETPVPAVTGDDLHKVACSSIGEWIGMKGFDGAYLWVNSAFTRGVGRSEQELIGLTDRDIFGYVTGRKLALSDQQAMDGCVPAVTTEQVPLESRVRHFEISRVLAENVEGEAWGIISVWRDLTEEIERRRTREQAMHQTIRAFAKSVEFLDPYLAAHADRLARVATAVARTLELDHKAITTLELAAMLSQVGKLGVDPNILRKPGRLTDEEKKQVEQHISHTTRLLRNFDIGLPVVVETIRQMHERLDGRGYPLGLKGPEISFLALILGACDVFCARIEPRAFRPEIPPERALELLEQNLDRYDESVIRALKEVILSPEGKKLVAGERAK